MKAKEKQRKFHDALLKMLYPPPPSPPPQEDEKDDEEKKLTDPLCHLPEELDDEDGNPSASGSENNEDDSSSHGKMTRAQRKRFRKKKIKEAACRRRKIIGPMLPGSGEDGNDADVEAADIIPQSVRRNAAVKPDMDAKVSGEKASCSKKNKLKQRRQSKKLAGEKLNTSSSQNSHKPSNPVTSS